MTIDCLFIKRSALVGIEEDESDGANEERAARLAMAAGREEIRGLRMGAIATLSRESAVVGASFCPLRWGFCCAVVVMG